ncbi:MAG: pyridoxamine 5'-phosphate oxidase family protein [Chloroflexi bacterium]|nr:pyridoxamine 5'-phosphate oxidase family protein [Chloroflexota bacterium]
MIELTPEMQTAVNNALADGVPCILATASADGKPGLGYRGSMMAFDGQSLAYWERAKRGGLDNIRTSPYVIVLYRNPATSEAWKFLGRATVHEDGDIRDQVMARTVQRELDRDEERQGFAVMIELDRIETLAGQVVQSQD